MSSCRKPEIHNELPKIPQIKGICFLLNKQWSKIFNYVDFIFF